MKLKKIVILIISAVTLLTCMPLEVLATQTNTETEPTETGSIENDLSIEGSSSLGNLIADELNGEYSEQLEANGSGVYSIEVTGNNAAVTFETDRDCTLVAAVYDEIGEQMLASGSTKVLKDDTSAEVLIETDAMPQYYVVKAFLIDTVTLKPICSSYESTYYTQEMQEILTLSADDFDEERVLNLDDDNTNNFAIYGESTITAESSGEINKVVSADEESETYVIENPDSRVAALQNGDILACEQENGEVLIVKVESAETDGTAITITGQDTSMEEVFDYVKIDSSKQAGEADYDPSTLSEGLTYEGFNELDENSSQQSVQKSALETMAFGEIEDEGVVPVGVEVKVNMAKSGAFTLTGSLKYSAEFSMKLYLSLKRQFIEFKVDNTINIKLTLTGKIEEKISLGSFDMMIFPGVNVGIIPKFVTKASVSFETSGTLTATIGFNYEHTKKDSNFHNLTTKPSYKDTMKIEGKLAIGLELEPNVSIISSKLVRFGFTGSAMAEISMARELYNSEAAIEADKYHECEVCFSGDIKVNFALSIDLTFLDSDKIKFSKDLASKDFKIADLYYSADHNDYNYGTCPWQQFRITVVVLGENLQPFSGAAVKIDDDEETYMTDIGGVVRFYLPGESSHEVTATCDGFSRTKNIKVARSPKCVYLWMLENSYHQGGGGSLGNIVKEEPYDPTKVTYRSMEFKIITESYEEPYAQLINYYGDEKHVVIPETVDGYTVKSIDGYAVCSDKTESVTIPSGVNYIKPNAFSGDNISNIYVSEQNEYFSTLDGVLFNEDKTWLVRYPRGKKETEYTIPETVTYIYESAFEWCEKLTSVKLPDSLTHIGDSAFMESGLTSIDFPDGLETIDHSAFDWCDGLTSITIPDSVTRLSGYAFGRCYNLKSVYIGSGVTYLSYRTFEDCYSLEDVTLSDGLITISDHVFYGCQALKSIKIPDSVKNIEYNVFDDSGIYYTCIDGIVYVDDWAVGCTEDCGGVLNFKPGTRGIADISKPEGLSITEINLPDGLKYISSYALSGCDITDINIPGSVKYIGADAFQSCTSLKNVTIEEGLEYIGDRAFYYCKELESINIPDSVVYVGSHVFYNCPVEHNDTDENGIYYVDNWVVLYRPKYGDYSESVIPIREGTVGIAAGVMGEVGYSYSYKSVIIPDGVKYICGGSCPYCDFYFSDTKNASITIPESVEYISTYYSNLFFISDIYYKGTREQWSNIKTYYDFGVDEFATLDEAVNGHFNPYGQNVSIHYSSTGPELETALNSTSYTTVLNTSPITIGADETTDSDNEEINPNLTQTEFKNLVPNEIYNLYIMKTDTAEDLLGSDNLLYIDQYTSDADGNITASYILKEEYDYAIIFLVRMSEIQLTAENTEITTDDLDYTGESQVVRPVVIYDGKELIPGTDYDIEGSFSAVSSGEYSAVIVGKGNYSGEVEFTYNVTSKQECQHEFVDGICIICGEECQHEFADGVCTICGEECQHEFADGVCTICGEECQHEFADGICTICGKECQHEFADGICTICGKECQHEFADGECIICGENEKQLLIGDVTQNGVIDLYDVIEIAKSLMKMRTFTDEEKIIADYNCDGVVDLYDAIAVARTLLP